MPSPVPRKLRWQGSNSDRNFAWNDDTIVAEYSLSGQKMAVLGIQMACCPPENVDRGAWAQQEILKFLNANHPWAVWS